MPASAQDFESGFDPTGAPEISSSDLLAMVNAGTPYSDKGLVITTNDTLGMPDPPDAASTTKWKRYIWLRVTPSAVIPYVWVDTAANHYDGSGNALFKWYTIAVSSIGDGTITGNMIADNTITNAKIVSLDASKLTGSLPALISATLITDSTAAGGDLTGTYPNPTVAASAITTAKINDLAVTNAKIAANTIVAADKIAPSGSALAILRTNAGATAPEWVVKDITELANPASSGDIYKVPSVKSPYTDKYELTLPRILQILETHDKTKDSTTNTCAVSATPTTSNCDLPAGLIQAITPKRADSTLLIEVGINIVPGGGQGVCALFVDATADAIAATACTIIAAGLLQQIVLRYSVAAASVAARTYKVGYSATSGTTYYNQTSTGNDFNGLGISSWIRVTEVGV